MTVIVHLVPGPDQHGVVRHARHVARACGHEVVGDAAAALAARADVVHVPFTDRLFAPTGEAAAAAFEQLATTVTAGGAALSVTLHDVPYVTGADKLTLRRRAVYARVIAVADAVVVNSRVDLAAVQELAARPPGPRLLRLVELPIDPVPAAPEPPADRDVGVLGFLYPDRGHEQVLHALPPGSGLVAVGRASAGHEHLPDTLAALARRLRRGFTVTGWAPDEHLAGRLARVAVPVAPSRRVTSSGSIGTWLAHGRRPLVPATAYTRELAARMPGALLLYDPDSPTALGEAIANALDDPARTHVAPGTVVGPSTSEVAERYRAVLAAAAPPAALRRGGRMVVPGNRWDLLTPARDETLISVVIPYHEAQADLDRVIAALTLQTVARRVEIVVADDGSPTAPSLWAAGALPARVVRQPRRGFGAARARNLGLRHARGGIIAFLDGDTVPEPDYLERLTARLASGAQVLAVGRRRHAALDGWSPAAVLAWLRHEGAAPDELPEPAWLRDAYTCSRDLLDGDARSYRHVISAVLAADRGLLDRLGGFDERFDHYGGEDWELANRAWNAGALVTHVPEAVAWHNGPDWAARDDPAAVKNAETATLARLLPDPIARGGGQWLPYPHVVVLLEGGDDAGRLACVRSALTAGVDCGFWTGAGESVDQRVLPGKPPADVLARAAVLAVVVAPCDLSGLTALAALAQRVGAVSTPALRLYSTRALNRCGLAAPSAAAPPPTELVRLFGHHERAGPAPYAELDLAHELARSARRSEALDVGRLP